MKESRTNLRSLAIDDCRLTVNDDKKVGLEKRPREELLQSPIASRQSSILDIPESFNVARYFVDRNVEEGCGDAAAVFYGDEVLTYRQVAEQVNRAANAFARAGIGRGDRVMLLLLDSRAFVAAFWGAIKLGAVPIPCNTSLTPAEDAFMLRDSGAKGLVSEAGLVEKLQPALAQENLKSLEAMWITVGPSGARPGSSGVRPDARPPAYLSFEEELAQSAPQAPVAPTHRDDPAFWLYTSGSTGPPKGAIHLQHDMVYCLELYARQVLGISGADRTFSTSKLYFAYGLGNGLYFPAGVGASTVLLPERPTAERVLAALRRYQPTLFFSVPTILSGSASISGRQRAGLPVGALRRIRRRGAAAGTVRAVSRAFPRSRRGRDRLHRDATHVHLQPAARDRTWVERQARTWLPGEDR